MTTSASRGQTTDVAPDCPAERPATADESSTHCFVIVDGSAIVVASRTAVDLLGGDTDDDLVGHQILEFIAATSMDAAQRRIERRAADDVPRPETMRLLRINGSEVRADVASTPITYAGRPHTQVNLWPLPDDDRAQVRRIAEILAHDGHWHGGLGENRGLRPDVVATWRPGRAEDLTAREREVLRCLMQGLSNQAAADRLDVTVNTVRNHVQRVLYKLDAHSKLEAVVVATRDGLLDPPV
jgi:PAS domain S-box-containing protein